MKQMIYLVAICSFLYIDMQNLSAQDTGLVTTEFQVRGVCDQCKTRIENAAYIKGVKYCEWNKETGMIRVIYNPEKVELQKIHESIASVGHSTDRVPASKEAYDKLPKCCAYDDGVHTH